MVKFVMVVSSKDNQFIKLASKLIKSRKDRYKEQLFVVEGVKICIEASKYCHIETIIIRETLYEQNNTDINNLLEKSNQIVIVKDYLCDKISDTSSPQGIFGICKFTDNTFSADKIKENGRYILLNSMQDSGNIGTIIRCADAFCFDGVILSKDCPDIYSPKVIRSTMGGCFRQSVMVTDQITTAINIIKQKNIYVYATALYSDSKNILDLELKNGCGFVIGNEGNGLPQEIIDQCNGSVIIPMSPQTESLNGAIAGSIVMWEAFKSTI